MLQCIKKKTFFTSFLEKKKKISYAIVLKITYILQFINTNYTQYETTTSQHGVVQTQKMRRPRLFNHILQINRNKEVFRLTTWRKPKW